MIFLQIEDRGSSLFEDCVKKTNRLIYRIQQANSDKICKKTLPLSPSKETYNIYINYTYEQEKNLFFW